MFDSTPVLMRVLLANKHFFPDAGAETVFFQTRSLLAQHGHEVIDFAMQHPRNLDSPQSRFFSQRREYVDAGRVRAGRDALASVYSPAAKRRMRELVQVERPEIAHLHNVYHQLTLSVVDALADAGVPIVLTLHDYKVGCPAYTLFRDGEPCHLCVTGDVENVIRHRCIKGSLGASLLAGAEAKLTRMRHTYHRVTAFIAPSSFAADIAIRAGLPRERVFVIPNCLLDDEIARCQATRRPHDQRDAVFVFAGRLDEVKGIDDLARHIAATDGPGRLRIIGDGPLRSEIETIARSTDRVEYLGRLPREDVLSQFGAARAAVVPSRWEENCPMSLIEARAAGAPIIASAHGGLPDLVTHDVDGILASPTAPHEWTAAIAGLATNRDRAARLASAGDARVEAEHRASTFYERTLDVYSWATRRQSLPGSTT